MNWDIVQGQQFSFWLTRVDSSLLGCGPTGRWQGGVVVASAAPDSGSASLGSSVRYTGRWLNSATETRATVR